MQQHNTYQQFLKNKVWRLMLLVLCVVPLMVQSQVISQEMDKEIIIHFPADKEEAKKIYHHTMNCIFNLVTSYHIEAYNTQYEKDMGSGATASEKQSALLPVPNTDDCSDSLLPLEYKQFLITLVKENYIKRNIEKLNNNEESPFSTQVVLCGTQYLEQEKQRTISPTYAVSVIGNCFYEYYKSYLEKKSSELPSIKSTDKNISMESYLNNIQYQNLDSQKEIQRSLEVFTLALQSFDEFIQAYPLHVRLEEIIVQSQKIRDQLRRMRIATDQLQYKLINQSVEK